MKCFIYFLIGVFALAISAVAGGTIDPTSAANTYLSLTAVVASKDWQAIFSSALFAFSAVN